MKKIQKHIEIVSSTEVGLSSMGSVSREAARLALTKHYTSVVTTVVNNLSDLEALAMRKPDLVFLGMKFIPGNQSMGRNDPRKIWLAEYLDEHDILYTGSGHESHILELNKELAKQKVMEAGLKTSAYTLVPRGSGLGVIDASLEYPLFVKPANRGGGQGIDENSLVNTFAELQAKVTSLSDELQADSLIENHLPGREFSVAILKNEFGHYSVMPIELVSEDTILSAAIKSANTEVVSAVTDKGLHAELCAMAMGVFEALGARDYGRIDIRMDQYGVPHFLEANLLPSLITNYGSFPKSCVLNKDLDYQEMMLTIVRLAFERDLDDIEEVLELGSFTPVIVPVLG